MALVHDMGESIIGDITPTDGISKGKFPSFQGFSHFFPFNVLLDANNASEEKFSREHKAMESLAGSIRPLNPTFASEIVDLWLEFEGGDTSEALMVRDLDAFECLCQANEYEGRAMGSKNLGDFQGLVPRIKTTEVKEWTKHLSMERGEFWSRNNAQ